MVYLTRQLLRKIKPTVFLDTIQLKLKGGHGGNGLPKYGGNGGQGGAIVLIAKEKATLRGILKKYPTGEIIGTNGEDSSKLRLVGRRGADVEIEAPVGITVVDANGNILSMYKIILKLSVITFFLNYPGELNEENGTFIAAGGGIGGCSDTNFIGKKGQSRVINLEMKLIADVGLVGFPNAGKSTFLKAISKAKPKIASYPFTTIQPNIGIIDYSDYRQISVADLPGLIEGAHANIGMGHSFLKHVERTKLLLIIVDIFGFQLSQKHNKRTCLQNIFSLMKELELYNKTLMDRPAMLLINKMDVDGSEKVYEKLVSQLKNMEEHLNECPDEIRPTKLLEFESVHPISAKHRQGIDEVITDIRRTLDLEAEKQLLELEMKSNRNLN
uniref:CSON011997 protein n=1 Tax=Culicoides sonorensis TaxID=179676 RepID=A0A336LJN5_CULSO